MTAVEVRAPFRSGEAVWVAPPRPPSHDRQALVVRGGGARVVAALDEQVSDRARGDRSSMPCCRQAPRGISSVRMGAYQRPPPEALVFASTRDGQCSAMTLTAACRRMDLRPRRPGSQHLQAESALQA